MKHGGVVEVAEAGHRDQQDRPGLAEHVSQLVAAVEEVDRDGRGAGAGDRELAGDELGVVGHLERDVLARPHPGGDETAREAQRPIPHLRVAVGGLVGDHVRAVRPPFGGGVERLVQRARHPRRVACFQGVAALGQRRQSANGHRAACFVSADACRNSKPR
jgi:hypothetical protein